MFNFKLPGRRNAGAPDPAAERARREATATANDERPQRPLADVLANLETPVGQVPIKPPESGLAGAGVAESGPAAASATEPRVEAGAEPDAATSASAAAAPEPVIPLLDPAALGEAQRRAAEQRQAAEAMLREAQLLEERIAAEAAAAIGEAEQRAVQEGQRAAARALAIEQHAAEQAATLQGRMDRMVSERKEHEVQADVVRVTERQAQAEVDARQALLEEALKAAATAAIAVTEVDRVVVGYMKREELLRKEIELLTTRIEEQREIRETAEAYAREAEARFVQLGVTDAPRTSIEEIRALETRLKEQLEAARRNAEAHRAAQAQAELPAEPPSSPSAESATAAASTTPPTSETAADSAMPHVA